MCLSVVVPVYNEAQTLTTVVEKLLRLERLREIIIVDDCSQDGTAEIAANLARKYDKVLVVRHSTNRGKTAGLKTGFQQTTGAIVVVQDADLEYDPEDIPSLIQPILDGHADVVYGSRFLIRRAARVLYFYHYLANRGLTFLSNLFTNINLTDVETGYKAFRGDIIREMIVTSEGFGFEIEVTAKIAKLRCAIFETPISYYGRTYEQGKKITFWDGVAALCYIFRFNLFCPLSRSFRKLPAVGGQARLQHVDTQSGPMGTPSSERSRFQENSGVNNTSDPPRPQSSSPGIRAGTMSSAGARSRTSTSPPLV